MATITTNRKELFHIINEVTKELKKKVNTAKWLDYNTSFQEEQVLISNKDRTIKWFKLKPEDPNEEQHLMKLESDDDEPRHNFGQDVAQGMLVGISWLQIRDYNNNQRIKTIPIVIVGSKVESEQVILRTNLRWYDHLRPSVIRMKSLIEYARKKRVKTKSVQIEHHLAKIIPDRIDKILLEGDKSEQD